MTERARPVIRLRMQRQADRAANRPRTDEAVATPTPTMAIVVEPWKPGART